MPFGSLSLTMGISPAASAAPGYAAWPALVGAEMMVNGDCSSGTGWGFAAGGSITGGKMQLVAYSDTAENDGITGTLIDGATYRCAFTIDTATLGSIQWGGGFTGTARSTAGTFSQDLTTSGDGASLTATSATMQLDNFSVKSIGLMGVEGDWAFTSDASWSTDRVRFGGGAGTAELTGAALTAFNAAVSNTTACSVTITVTGYTEGSVKIALKGGTAVDMAVTADGNFTKTITSGAGSGFLIENVGAPDPDLGIARIQIALA